MKDYSGQEVEDSVFLVADRNVMNKGYNFSVSVLDPRKYKSEYSTSIFVKEIKIDVVVPTGVTDVTLGNSTVELLREKQSELRDEVNTKCNNIDEQIQEILCIGSDNNQVIEANPDELQDDLQYEVNPDEVEADFETVLEAEVVEEVKCDSNCSDCNCNPSQEAEPDLPDKPSDYSDDIPF